jgi:3-oxoacyl-[acyl-carrier protein] reductase
VRDLLPERVAIVTGAAQGIGLECARLLAAEGARVMMNDLDGAELERAAAQVGAECELVAGDVTDPVLPAAIVERTVERWGGVDIVVNNAGYNWDAPLEAISDEQFQAMLDVHMVAPFRLLRAAKPHLTAPAEPGAPRRKVVNFTSVAATMGMPGQGNYNAAKAAVIGFTKGLAKEWGGLGVNVNAIAPGFIDTRLTGPLGVSGVIQVGDHEIELGIPENRRAAGAESTAIGRPGTATEVASAVLFLCSPLAEYVTGQVVSVNGGLALGMSA